MVMTVNGCCCMSLRTAGFAHGWVGIVLFSLAIIRTICRMIYYDPNEEPVNSFDTKPRTMEQLSFGLGAYFLDILISGLLVTGIAKNKHYLLLPWLILRAFGLMLAIPIGLIILVFFSISFKPQIIVVALIYAIIIGLFCWSWIVIYSLHKEIRTSVNKPLQMQAALPYYESQSGGGPLGPAPPYQMFDK